MSKCSMPKATALSCALVLLLLIAGCGNGEPSDDVASSDPQNPATSTSPENSTLDLANDADSNAVRILFLGDSITAGLGVDQLDAFPARIEARLKTAGYNVDAIDAGVSGDTSTGGLNRLDWLLQNRIDILVLELGGNDGLRGVDLSLTRSNLGAIIEETRQASPSVQIVLVGMRVPPNLGQAYTEEFASMYPETAQKYGTHYVPFIADAFEDIVHLLQNDGIHPTEEGHAIIAERVGDVVEPLVAEMSEAF